MTKFTIPEMRVRALHRIADVVFGQFEEGRATHSRIFEVLVPDEFVVNGQSIKGGGYREHVVPCALIRDECTKMFERGATKDEVVQMLDKHLRIAIITPEEAHYMDHTLGLKATMPKGWIFGEDDPLERLKVANIVLS